MIKQGEEKVKVEEKIITKKHQEKGSQEGGTRTKGKQHEKG
jgi:hypothetical protein